jgi:predicted nucleic acid-binding protein
MSEFFCYTTVFNAAELFSLCRTQKERLVVEHVMYSMKVLGLNGKSAKNLGEVIRRTRNSGMRQYEALIAGVCLESRLPLLTARPERYKGIRSLRLVRPGEIRISDKKGT